MEKSDIIKRKLASKYDIPIEVVEKIIEAPFLLIVDEMSKADREKVSFPTFRILKLGVFYVSKRKKAFFKTMNEKERRTSG